MPHRPTARLFRAAVALTALPTLTTLTALPAAAADVDPAYISEIFFNTPGGDDRFFEWIELRGTPGASLDDHYLLFLENEGPTPGSGNADNRGQVDAFFDLSGATFGDNGYLLLLQGGFTPSFPNPLIGVADPDATVLAQDGDFSGWGDANGPSTIGWNAPPDDRDLEGSGFTAFLIHDDGGNRPPVVLEDLDAGNDGLDPLPTSWTVLDGIGVFGEDDEPATGRLYADLNFGPAPTNNLEPGATYIEVDFEVEYVARLGESTGSTPDDWWVGNLTDNPRGPGADEFEVTATTFFLSAADTDAGDQTGPVEASTDQFAYGTLMSSTLGGPNLGTAPITVLPLAGDFNGNGVVEQGDLDLVLGNWGALSTPAGFVANTAGLTDGVDQDELDAVLGNWGGSSAPWLGNPNAVPEPAAAVALGLTGLALLRRRAS